VPVHDWRGWSVAQAFRPANGRRVSPEGLRDVLYYTRRHQPVHETTDGEIVMRIAKSMFRRMCDRLRGGAGDRAIGRGQRLSGVPTAPIWATRAIRRSIRSPPANFSTLEVAWRFKTDSLGPRPEYQFESTPLMVGGVVYSTAGSRRAVVALDAGTGELLWMHSENEGARGAAAPRQLSGPRAGVLAGHSRPGRSADPLRHAGLSARGAQREDRPAHRRLRDRRHRRSKKDDDQEMDLITGENRAPIRRRRWRRTW